jgi:predicted Zn finger-like uncharacterized protein
MILGCPNCGARFRIGADAIGAAGRRVRCSQCHHQWNATARDLQPDPVAPKPKVTVRRNPLKPKKAAPPPPPPPPPVAEEPPAAPPPPPPEPPPPPPDLDLAPPAPLPDAAADAQLQAEPEPPPPIPEAPSEAASMRGKKTGPKKRSVLGRIAAAIGWLLFVLALGGLAGAAYESETVMEQFPETKPVFEALGFDVPGPGDGLKLTNVTSARVTIEGSPALVVEGKITNTTQGRRTVPTLRGSLRDTGDRELQAWTFNPSTMRLAPGETASFRTEIRQPPSQATGLSITFVAAH